MKTAARAFAVALAFAAGGPLTAETLPEAVQKALSTNPGQSAAFEATRAAVLDLASLRGRYLPQVTLTGSVGAERISNPGSLSASDNETVQFARQIGVGAEYVIYDGVQRAQQVYASAAQVDAALYSLWDASDTLALNVVETYADVARNRLLKSMSEESLRLHRRVASQIEDAVAGGSLPQSEALQVRDRVLAAEVSDAEIGAALASAEARYLAVVSGPPSGRMRTSLPTGLPASQAELLDAAVASNGRLLAAQAGSEAARAEAARASAPNRPRVTVNADVGAAEDIGGSEGSQNNMFLGLRLSWSLFEGGSSARGDAAEARRAQAEAREASTRRDIERAVADAWIAHQSVTTTRSVLERQTAANESIVRQFRSEFESGDRSLLNVLDAERTLLGLKIQLASARASEVVSAHRLLATQGALASYFGVEQAGVAVDPDFAERARNRPMATAMSASDLTRN